jgi:hypothetical protein
LLPKVGRLFGWFVPRGFPRTNHPFSVGPSIARSRRPTPPIELPLSTLAGRCETYRTNSNFSRSPQYAER